MFTKKEKEEVCSRCKGKGKVWWANYLEQSDCPVCNGTGKVVKKNVKI